jgi:hypothetical protein
MIGGLYSIGLEFVWKKQQECNLSEISKLVKYACKYGKTEYGNKNIRKSSLSLWGKTICSWGKTSYIACCIRKG